MTCFQVLLHPHAGPCLFFQCPSWDRHPGFEHSFLKMISYQRLLWGYSCLSFGHVHLFILPRFAFAFFFSIYATVLAYIQNVVIKNFQHFSMSHCQTEVYIFVISLWNLNAQLYGCPVPFHLASISLLLNMSEPLKFWCYPCVSFLSWLCDIWKLKFNLHFFSIIFQSLW